MTDRDEDHDPTEPSDIETVTQVLSRELDESLGTVMSAELDSLVRITRFTQAIETKLERLYRAKFPKACSKCGRIFATREDYLRETAPLRGKSINVDETGIQEYRNCICGTTLMLWTSDRRDQTDFGQARRSLFDACLSRLEQISTEDDSVLRARLRRIFRAVSQRFSDPS